MKTKTKKEIQTLRNALKKENLTFKANFKEELQSVVENKKREIKEHILKRRKELASTEKEINEIFKDFDPEAIIKKFNSKLARFTKIMEGQQTELEKKISKIKKVKSASLTRIENYLKELKNVENGNMRSINKDVMGIEKNLEKFTQKKNNVCDKIFYNITEQ